MCLATLPQTSTDMCDASMPSVSQRVPREADTEEQIRRVVADLPKINAKLENASPADIIRWSIDNLPHLYQTTAFGVTGCVTLDIISRISAERSEKNHTELRHLVPLIFVDTLYHFPQTLDLAERASSHYDAAMYVYKRKGSDTVADFERTWGSQLWQRDEDTYDYLVKVEPARRAYEELDVRAVFTGRRRSQGADRASLQAVEVDETGLIKVNALLNWDFAEDDKYVQEIAGPYIVMGVLG